MRALLPLLPPAAYCMALLGCDASVNIHLLPLTTSAQADAATAATSTTTKPQVDTSAVMPDAAVPAPSPALDANADTAIITLTPDAGGISKTSLIHHYTFDGEGTLVVDSVGAANGEVFGGAVLDGNGGLELDGLDDFVDLPNGILSSLSSATVSLWVVWRGGICWQRLFDFGSSTGGEDTTASAQTSLFVTPASCRASHIGPVEDNVISLMFHAPGNYSIAQDVNSLPTDTRAFVALSVSDDGTLSLSIDGQTVAVLASALRLADLNDVNNWIGRSQWGQDPTLRAQLLDLRIYDVALTNQQLINVFAQSAQQL